MIHSQLKLFVLWYLLAKAKWGLLMGQGIFNISGGSDFSPHSFWKPAVNVAKLSQELSSRVENRGPNSNSRGRVRELITKLGYPLTAACCEGSVAITTREA